MPNNRDHIRSEAVQDILSRMPHWMIIWGNSIVLVLLLLFFLMSWFIKYPDIISAEAVITSTNPPQKEYATTTGKLENLQVKDGDYVQEGNVLAMFENSSSLDDVLLLKSILDTIAISTSLEFPVEDIPVLALGDLASPYAIFEKDYIDYTLNKSLDPFTNLKLANSQSEQQIILRIKNLKIQKELEEKSYNLA